MLIKCRPFLDSKLLFLKIETHKNEDCMKNMLRQIISIFCVLCLCVACGTDDPIFGEPTPEQPGPLPEEKVIGTTEKGSSQLVMLGYEDNVTGEGVLKPEGLESFLYIKDKKIVGESYSFAVCDAVKRLDAMPAFSTLSDWKEWGTVTEETVYWIRHTAEKEYTYIKLRIAYIDGNRVGVEYLVSSREAIVNVNANQAVEGKEYVTDYSIPHLNPDNYYVEHTVSVNNKNVLNYALEWDATAKHAAWVAFVFDETTRKNSVDRTDAWDVDPQLPKDMQTNNDHHRNDGFDRGHLCASEDRVYAGTANRQTFYYSNMSPQFNSFNGGFWAAFENRVRNWGRRSFDKLYVTKGGALNQLLVNYTGEKKGNDGVFPQTDAEGRTIHGLACPKYYYMAVLAEKNGSFQAIGFWIEHRDDYGYEYGDKIPVDIMQKYVVSIDKLEQETGIDFFCNLPDGIENQVESAYDVNGWDW